jgi:hypothetical protein
MRRTVIACVAALAAAVSVGALGYAVLWAFDLSEPMRPVMQQREPPEARRDTTEEAKQPAPRRRPLVAVAPRVPGEDARASASPAAHAAPVGCALVVAPAAPRDEPSPLLAVAPPPTPPAPGMDGPAVSASTHIAVPSHAVGRPTGESTESVSALIPQGEATAPPAPLQAPAAARPDPEPTGAIHPPPFRLSKPRVIQVPREREETVSAPPGVTIIRGVPPVSAASPGIVRPGPLIIQVPQGTRR